MLASLHPTKVKQRITAKNSGNRRFMQVPLLCGESGALQRDLQSKSVGMQAIRLHPDCFSTPSGIVSRWLHDGSNHLLSSFTNVARIPISVPDGSAAATIAKVAAVMMMRWKNAHFFSTWRSISSQSEPVLPHRQATLCSLTTLPEWLRHMRNVGLPPKPA